MIMGRWCTKTTPFDPRSWKAPSAPRLIYPDKSGYIRRHTPPLCVPHSDPATLGLRPQASIPVSVAGYRIGRVLGVRRVPRLRVLVLLGPLYRRLRRRRRHGATAAPYDSGAAHGKHRFPPTGCGRANTPLSSVTICVPLPRTATPPVPGDCRASVQHDRHCSPLAGDKSRPEQGHDDHPTEVSR